jgi:hypothetical protein
VFRHPRHWVIVSRTLERKLVVMSSTVRIVFDVRPFDSDTLTICRNVRNHLPSNVTSYNRRKVRLFIPLWKPTNFCNSINPCSNCIVYELLRLTDSATVHVTSNSFLNSWRYQLPLDNNIYYNWLTVNGVQLYSVIIGNGINW